MMWMSRIVLDPRSREVQRDLADVHALHRRIMAAFPAHAGAGGARAAHRVLFRLDMTRHGALHLLVQSGTEPASWRAALPERYALEVLGDDAIAVRDARAVLEAVAVGSVFDFRLRANPSRRLAQPRPEDRLERGARVGLRRLDEQIGWLERKATAHGFRLLGADGAPEVVDRDRSAQFGHPTGRGRLTFEGVTFDGRLRVEDPERFRSALVKGIGSAKAFGFGLLSIAAAGSLDP